MTLKDFIVKVYGQQIRCPSVLDFWTLIINGAEMRLQKMFK